MTARPADIRSDLLWERDEHPGGLTIRAHVNPLAHPVSCNVCWGSHGCSRPLGHEGAHWCDCCECDDHPDEDSGCVAGPPYYGPRTEFFTV